MAGKQRIARHAVTRRSRVVFFGTPEFAVPTLQALASSDLVELTGVVTQPDRPSGRGRRVQSPPVMIVANHLGVPVLQAPTLRDPAARSWLLERNADLFVVAAFGLILGRRTLAMPRLGALNIHASLLPRYRGASPVACAIAMGERETGVSLMQMDAGLDTGPVFARCAVEITPSDTTASLTHRLAGEGARLLMQTLPEILDESLEAVPQSGIATLTRPLVKEDGRIDWHRPAQAIVNQVRAMLPWPRAFTTLESGTQLQVHQARVIDEVPAQAVVPGQVAIAQGRLAVACGTGWVELEMAQLPGARMNTGAQLLQRRALTAGERLGTHHAPTSPPPLLVEIKSSD